MTHSDVGDDTAAAGASRRTLIGSALAGAVAAIAGGRSVAAASTSTSPLSSPLSSPVGGDESEVLAAAMRLELTARDLYDAAIRSGGAVELAGVMREQHEAYAQSIAAFTGGSANQNDAATFDSLVVDFSSDSDQAVAEAAYDLESTLVATHTELVGLVEDVDAARLIASILVVEARHCAVLADASGRGDDLDALLVNDADPIAPEDLT